MVKSGDDWDRPVGLTPERRGFDNAVGTEMRYQVLTLAALTWAVPTAWSVAPVAGAQSPSGSSSSSPAAATRPKADHREVVTKYCVSCHNERLKTGGLMLDTVDVSDPAAAAEVWERAVRKMRVGMMPPQGAPHPDAATRRRRCCPT